MPSRSASVSLQEGELFEVEVCLDECRSATALDLTNSFTKDEIHRATNRIQAILDQNRSSATGMRPRSHEAVTILGERGAGKTTFLLSLVKHFSSAHEQNVEPISPPLDPTILEESDTFLVTITEAILQQCTAKGVNVADNTALKEKLIELSHCFRVLAHKNREEIFKDCISDPELFAYESLMMAKSGISLADAFHAFAKVALEALGNKRAFLLCIDDVDMAFERGWLVLETLRKYLNTPYIVTVISGDLELFETLTRRHFIQHLSQVVEFEDRRHPSSIGGRTASQIPQLSSQYLLKLLPPANRIHLPSPRKWIITRARATQRNAGGSLGVNQTNIFVTASNYKRESRIPLEVLFGNFAKAFLGSPGLNREREHTAAFLDPATSAVANLVPDNMRMFVRLLEVLYQFFTTENVSEAEKPAILQRLTSLHQSLFYNKGIEGDRFLLLAQGGEYEWLAQRLLTLHEEMPDAWRMECNFNSNDDNIIALLLQAVSSVAWSKQHWAPLRYLAKVVLPGWAWGKLQGQDVGAFINRVRLQSRENPGITASRALLETIEIHRRDYFGSGYMAIRQRLDAGEQLIAESRGSKAFAGITSERPVLSAPQFLRNSRYRAGFVLNLFSCRYGSGYGQAHWYVSFFTGLGYLSDILAANDQQELRTRIHVATSISTFYKGGDSGDVQATAETGTGSDERDDRLRVDASEQGAIVDALWTWKERLAEQADWLPPNVIAASFFRLLANLESIGSGIAGKDQSVGYVMRQWMIAYIASILIEEANFRKHDVVSWNHAVTVDKVLVQNLNSVGGFGSPSKKKIEVSDAQRQEIRNRLPITYIWAQCPVFKDLLLSSEGARSYFYEEHEIDAFMKEETSLFNELCRIPSHNALISSEAKKPRKPRSVSAPAPSVSTGGADAS